MRRFKGFGRQPQEPKGTKKLQREQQKAATHLVAVLAQVTRKQASELTEADVEALEQALADVDRVGTFPGLEEVTEQAREAYEVACAAVVVKPWVKKDPEPKESEPKN